MLEDENDINTVQEASDYHKNNKLIKEIISLAMSYKSRNIDDIKNDITKKIKSSKIEPRSLKTQENETLAHLIIKEDKSEAVEIIIDSYISLLGVTDIFFDWLLSENQNNETIMDLSAQNGNREIIKYIYTIISKTTEKKFRILENRKGIFHYAAMYNQCYPIIFFYEKLQKFFKNTSIIDVPTELGITPLHYACFKNSKNAVDLLLDLGANINALDEEGNSCLHFAVNSNNPALIKKLLVRGADKNIKNSTQESPLDLAIKNNNKTIVDILSTQNFFIQNPCSQNHEITGIKSSHNNITLFIVILFLGIAKWIFLSRIYFISEGDFKFDVVPFIYEIETAKTICNKTNITYEDCEINDTLIGNYTDITNSTRFKLQSISELFKDNVYGYTHLKNLYVAGWFFSMFEIVILLLILKFLCFSSHIFIKKNSFRKVPSLIKLFETHRNICIKCRASKNETTVHCIVCNGCVRDFDHHCTWLNICISKHNITWFRVFLYLFLVYVITNILFFIYSK